MRGLGTAINVATILLGTGAGILVGRRLPERARTTMLQGVGLVVIALGVGQTVHTRNMVFPLVAIVAGALIGELLGIEDRLESLGDHIRRRFERSDSLGTVDVDVDVEVEGAGIERAGLGGAPTTAGSTFVEGFVDASLLFVVGPLAVLGSIADGLRGDLELLVVKSALDGLVSVILGATLGLGVAFSALPVLAYQALLTLAAGGADSVLTDRMTVELTATGGVMVMGIGLRVLDIKRVRVGSMLPALILAPVLVGLFAR
jgi:uncharacterized membrane protein YqgA involved in biofilm formation